MDEMWHALGGWTTDPEKGADFAPGARFRRLIVTAPRRRKLFAARLNMVRSLYERTGYCTRHLADVVNATHGAVNRAIPADDRGWSLDALKAAAEADRTRKAAERAKKKWEAERVALSLACMTCRAKVGEPCRTVSGRVARSFHAGREVPF